MGEPNICCVFCEWLALPCSTFIGFSFFWLLSALSVGSLKALSLLQVCPHECIENKGSAGSGIATYFVLRYLQLSAPNRGGITGAVW